MPDLAQVAFVLLVLAVLAWPFLHAALLVEGVRFLEGRRPRAAALLVAVLLAPIALLAVQLGWSCAGAILEAFVPAPIVLVASVAVALAARMVAYAALFGVHARGAFALSLGVTLVASAYAGMLLVVALGGLWAAWM